MSESEALAISSCPKVRRRVVGSNVWLLSFGDLVTLLLGFFVAIIAYALQNPPKPPPELSPQKVEKSGTALATVPVQKGPQAFFKSLLVPAAEFDASTGGLLEGGRNLLKEQLNLTGVDIKASSVSSCIATDDGDLEKSRFAVMGRSLAMVSQLIDMGVPVKSLRVETPGASCEQGLVPGAVLVSITGQQVR